MTADIEDAATRAEGAIRSEAVDRKTLETLRAELAAKRDILATEIDKGDVAVRALQAEQAELPPPPEKDATEPERIASERARLADALAAADAPLLSKRQALARLKVLIADLDRLIRRLQREQTFARGPTPLMPETWTRGIASFGDEIGRVSAELAQDAQIPSRRAAVDRGRLIFALVFPAAILAWVLAGGVVLPWIEAREAATTGRLRKWRTLLSLFLRGFVPLVLSAFAVGALAAPFLRPGRFPELLPQLLVAPLVLAAASWLGHVLFAPGAAHRRIVRLPQAAAQRAARLTQGLGLVVVLELLAESPMLEFRLGPESDSLLALFLLSLAAALLWSLARTLLQPPEGETTPELRKVLAQALRLVAIAAVAAAILGFSALGRAIIDPLALSLWLIGLTVVGQRGVLLVLSGMRRLSRHAAGVDSDAEKAASKLAAIGVVTLLALLSVPLHALVWGARAADLWDGYLLFRNGVDIGGVRFSIGTVAVLVLTFAAGVVLTRWTQKLLRDEVLPNTRIDRGGQSAIVTGFGYAGLLVSALIAVTLAGINLSSLAIVAGALSVGIGFGLQAIVSNFVSGIILLIERPIKEGDWIEVSGQSGTVRKISVRSTRLETFDGHDVIVPNADLITGSVRNMTLSSLSGRIDLPVGVAYGSDLAKVREILLGIAKAHPMVLDRPEPVVLLIGPGDSSVNLELRCFVRYVSRGIIVRSELYFSILAALEDAGVTIPYPVRDLRITQANPLSADPPPEPAA